MWNEQAIMSMMIAGTNFTKSLCADNPNFVKKKKYILVLNDNKLSWSVTILYLPG